MDIKTLREFHRNEKMSPYLLDLGKDFYDEAQDFLKNVYSQYKALSKEGDFSKVSQVLRELENLKNILSDLYETRERKIVSNALYYVKSGESVQMENLTKEEEVLLSGIVRLLRDNRNVVMGTIFEIEESEELKGPRESSGKKVEPATKGSRNTPAPIEKKGQARVEKDEVVTGSRVEAPIKKESLSKKETPRQKIELVTVRILKDLPSIVGIDGKVYGEFKEADVVALPKPNGTVFIKQGVAEEVKVGE